MSYKNFKKFKQSLILKILYLICIFLNKYVFRALDKLLKTFSTYIVFLREDRIGHQAGNADIEFYKAFNRKKYKNENTIFIFPFPKYKVSNLDLRERLISYASQKSYKTLVINYKYFKEIFFKLIFFAIPIIFKSCKNIYFSSSDTGLRVKEQILKKSDNHKNLCKKLEINSKDYICITSRDENYLKYFDETRNWDYHNYRNSDIDNLKKLALYAKNELKMDVVRIGSNPKKRIKWTSLFNPKIIDYSFSQYASPKNDIELIAGCNLFINNGGGPVAAAVAARREIITINHIPIRMSIGYVWGLWIPKILKVADSKKILSFREIEKLELAKALNSRDYLNANVEIFENEEDDILNAIKDYFKIKNGLINSEERIVLKKYKEVRDETAHLYRHLSVPNDKDIISPSFLLRYPELLA